MLATFTLVVNSLNNWLIAKVALLDNKSFLKGYVKEGNNEQIAVALAIPEVRERIAENSNELFILACESGKTSVVKAFLNIPAVRESVTASNNEALYRASVRGHLAIVRKLLKIQSVVDLEVANKTRALKGAAIYDQKAAFYTMLDIPAIKQQFMSQDNSETLNTVSSKGLYVMLLELLTPKTEVTLYTLKEAIFSSNSNAHLVQKVFWSLSEKDRRTAMESHANALIDHFGFERALPRQLEIYKKARQLS